MKDRDNIERSNTGVYEPPAIVTPGSVEDFTAGEDSGSPTLDGF